MKRLAFLLLGLVAGLALAGIAVWTGGATLARYFGRGPDPTTIVDASLRGVQAQNKLTAFAARFTVAITSEQQRLGLLHAKKTLIVPGTVRYELDWNRLTRRDLAWNATTRTLTITLPQPVLAGPEIDLARIREYREGMLLMALTDAESVLDTANRAQVRTALLNEARAAPLLAMARDATAQAVQRTFALPLGAAGVDAKVAVKFAA